MNPILAFLLVCTLLLAGCAGINLTPAKDVVVAARTTAVQSEAIITSACLGAIDRAPDAAAVSRVVATCNEAYDAYDALGQALSALDATITAIEVAQAAGEAPDMASLSAAVKAVGVAQEALAKALHAVQGL